MVHLIKNVMEVIIEQQRIYL